MAEALQHNEWSGKTGGLPWMQRSLIAMFRVLPLWLLYGVMAMRAFSGFGYPELRLPEIWAHVVLPLCVSAPFLFLSCEAGMLLADASLSVMTSGNAADRSMVLKRQALHLSGAIGTLLFWYWLR